MLVLGLDNIFTTDPIVKKVYTMGLQEKKQPVKSGFYRLFGL